MCDLLSNNIIYFIFFITGALIWGSIFGFLLIYLFETIENRSKLIGDNYDRSRSQRNT
jgi:hypothetical protein